MQPYQSPNGVEDPKLTIANVHPRKKWPAISVLAAYLLLLIAYFSIELALGSGYGTTVFGFLPPNFQGFRRAMFCITLICLALAGTLILVGLLFGSKRTRIGSGLFPVFFLFLYYLLC